MTKFKFLLLGTSLSCFPALALGQCVATQDCATLGYTETSCNGGKGVKCPFGNKWACLGANEEECKQKFCDEYRFTLTCTGTGYAGGAGSACDGKYIQCNCAEGYEWKNGSCQKETPTEGVVGEQYYCNGKVVGVKVPGMNFFVAIENVTYNGSQTMIWSNANEQAIRAFCGKGRSPTRDELSTIYNNKSKINSLSSAAGGQNLTNDYYWSSAAYGYDYHYILHMSDGHDRWGVGLDSHNYYVRPVLMDY